MNERGADSSRQAGTTYRGLQTNFLAGAVSTGRRFSKRLILSDDGPILFVRMHPAPYFSALALTSLLIDRAPTSGKWLDLGLAMRGDDA